VVDVASGAVDMVAKGVHGGLHWRGDRLVAIRSGARTPTEIVVYNTDRWSRTAVARGPVAGFEPALVEPEVVTWPAEDGAEIHGRLYRPRHPATGDDRLPPLVAMVHGGPTSQWQVSFMPRIAWLVDQGWAVLLPDHRGSTGHGRAYAQALRGRWGEVDVEDTAAGLRAAADRGWADPRRLVVMGGSAGGFTVLNLLALHPDLCAAGIDLFGVADLVDLNETTHRFEAHYEHHIVGPLPETADRYVERSPVTVADRITAPLLVLQGSDDKVVAPEQSAAIVGRLRSLGRTVESYVYDGEGHGWMRPETMIDEMDRVASFLTRHALRYRT
jgi:dipeptidyl aminopeptidase/acylaminoacyl peptidase